MSQHAALRSQQELKPRAGSAPEAQFERLKIATANASRSPPPAANNVAAMMVPNDAAHAMRPPVVVAMPDPAMMPAVMTAHAAVKTAMAMPARTDVRGLTFEPDL